MKSCVCFYSFLLMVFLPMAASGAVINVPGDQPTIQEGIAAAVAGDTVLVADGTYTGEKNKDIKLGGKAITLMSATGAANCVIDCESSGRGFRIHQGEGLDTIIQGFTICNGGSIDADGGGVLCDDTSPTITECIFTNNIADFGGAIYVSEGSPAITNSIFNGNSADIGGAITTHPHSVSGMIIGGSPGAGNHFEGNHSGSGADICVMHSFGVVINASYNTFTGNHLSDYYVTPAEFLDLSNCSSDLTLITQDVYVSPDGDDSNDGLTSDTAFKTIHHAMTLVSGTDTNPVTVHLGPGTYSTSGTGEIFPVPVMDYVNISGDTAETTVIDAEGMNTVVMSMTDNDMTIQDVTITGGQGIYLGGGMLCGYTSSPTITNCIFSDNSNPSLGGGLCLIHEGSPTVTNCTFSGNTAEFGGGILLHDKCLPVIDNCTFSGNSCTADGGGIAIGALSDAVITNCIFSDNIAGSSGGVGIQNSSPIIYNCLISENTASNVSGGIGLSVDSSPVITNCTIANNTAAGAGGMGSDDSNSVLTNCVIWGNTPDSISNSGGADPQVTYSDVQGGYAGDGNIDVDPLFTDGYHLCATLAGDTADSPCIDVGSDLAENCYHMIDGMKCWMNTMVTRCDDNRDRAQIDMGYHYPSPILCDTLGCTLDMPSDYFQPGDECFLDLYICNPSAQTYTDNPLFLILDVFGSYYFAPTFADFEYYSIPIEPGFYVVEVIPQFFWPSGVGSATGLYFYAAMTDAAILTLFGELAMFEFGWGD